MGDATIFDRAQVRRQRDRAAAGLAAHDFLLRDSAARLIDRLEDITRTFPLALELGCHDGGLTAQLKGRFGIKLIIAADLSPGMARRAQSHNPGFSLVADEEMLPFAEGRFDLVISNLSLHWVNDLPGSLLQIRRLLKPDGLFLGCMLGGQTLRELRSCLMDADLATDGGAGPRVSPFVDVKDAGALLQRAGFSLPVTDLDSVTVTYGDPLRLLTDLRGMGEGNAVAARRKSFSRRDSLAAALALYHQRFADAEGRLAATFQLVTLTGWRPIS